MIFKSWFWKVVENSSPKERFIDSKKSWFINQNQNLDFVNETIKWPVAQILRHIFCFSFQDFSSESSGKLSSKLFSFWSKSEPQNAPPKLSSNSPHPLRKSRIDQSKSGVNGKSLALTTSKLESVSNVLGHGHQFHHHGLGHPSRSPFQLNGMCRADQTSSSTKPTWMVNNNASLQNHQRNQNQGW